MSHRLTDDEKFLVALAQHTKPGQAADPMAIGALAGMTTRRTAAISLQLVRTNFIKRHGDDEVILTDHGRRLATELQP
jgi:predicted transcriptional regulator